MVVCMCVFFVARLNPRYFFIYKAHSFRNGAASWASSKGFFVSQIRSLRYIRTPGIRTQLEDTFS